MSQNNLMAQLAQQQASELGEAGTQGIVDDDAVDQEPSGSEDTLQDTGHLTDESETAEAQRRYEEEQAGKDQADNEGLKAQLADLLGVDVDTLKEVISQATANKADPNSYTEAEIVQQLSIKWDMKPSEVRGALPDYVAYYNQLPAVEQARIDAMGYDGFDELQKGLQAATGNSQRTETTMNLGRSTASPSTVPKRIYESDVVKMSDAEYEAAQPAILAAIRAGTYISEG